MVGGEREAHSVIADIDVGMVPGLLGQLADPVHKVQGSAKIIELKGFDKLPGFDLPAREANQTRLSFLWGKRRHGFDPLRVQYVLGSNGSGASGIGHIERG